MYDPSAADDSIRRRKSPLAELLEEVVRDLGESLDEIAERRPELQGTVERVRQSIDDEESSGGGESALDRLMREALAFDSRASSTLHDSGYVEPPATPTSRIVGDFELVRRLGRGGQGEVWEARQRTLERRVALKLLHADRLSDRTVQTFAREARAGGRLSHPGIVTVYASGESEGVGWLAMEYVAGGRTLGDLLLELGRANELPVEHDCDVAELVAAVAEAVQAAHDAGVIHRDLKPQNILLTPDGEPKVTDFGLARITDESVISRTGSLVGTPHYMSPEQVSADQRSLDHRTDVFSLGVVLYELLTLRRPFQGDTWQQLESQILNRDPDDPRVVRSRIPRELAVIVGKALEKDRDLRFQSMSELASDLRRFLAHEPIRAQAPTRRERAIKWIRRNPTRSVAVAATLIAFVTISTLLSGNVEANRALTVTNGELLTANQTLVEQRVELQRINVSLEAQTHEADQQRVRAIFGHRLAEARRLRTLARSQIDTAPKLALLLAIEAARRGPGEESNTLVVRALDGAGRLPEYKGHALYVRSLDHSADGRFLLSGGGDEVAIVWDIAKRSVHCTLEHHRRSIVHVACAPSGGLALTLGLDRHVNVWELETGRRLHGVTMDAWPFRACFDGPQRITLESMRGFRRSFDALTLREELPTPRPDFAAAPISDPGGRWAVILRHDEPALIVDAKTGASCGELPASAGSPVQACFTPDGETLLTISGGATLNAWQSSSWTQATRVDFHGQALRHVAISPDGRWVVVGSFFSFDAKLPPDARPGPAQDLRVLRWPSGDEHLVVAPANVETSFTAVAFTPDSERLVIADSRPRLWSVPLEPLVTEPLGDLRPLSRLERIRYGVSDASPAPSDPALPTSPSTR
ncbi:MAG: protein kinase [bacterium]|nr:protein kinase [bacterium]